METLSMFDLQKIPLKIDKPIRLIELFAGIGSQAKALKRLGADFEHYRVCEFDKYAIKSYNAIHGTDFVTSDITQIGADDLGIVDTDKYCYIMTYSFPCQDLSLAGKGKGMAKGENTRSGLLWEVERLLNECKELPQILLMENVTQVHGTKNKEHFNKWLEFLESKGYCNYWKDLNAKNFGIPQNRNRTFMVSVLGDYTYEFPQEFPLELRLKDMLEDNVDEKFYLSGKMINYFTENTKKQQAKGNGFKFQPTDGSGCDSFPTTRAGGRMDDNFIEEQPVLIGGMQKNQAVKTDGISTTLTSSMGMGGGYVPMVIDPQCEQAGVLTGGKWDKMHDVSRRVYSGEGVAPTIHTCGSGNTQPKVIAGIGEKKSNGGTQWYQQDRVYDDKVAISVTTGFNPYYAVAMRGRYNENGAVEQNVELSDREYANAITTVQKDSLVAGPQKVETYYVSEKGVKFICSPKRGMTTDINADVCQPLTAKGQANWTVRKLTPKECWRLMGFDDADFLKAATVNSNSQLYKQAGNSIVVDVLCYIFREML